MAIRSYRDLIVWNKGMELTVHVYQLVKGFPPDERFRLIDQVCRSAASIPANIAEGHARATKKEYAQFLAIAQGSLAETETFLLLAERLGFAGGASLRNALATLDEISRMLSALRRSLRTAKV
jgi:four helix bundle protein